MPSDSPYRTDELPKIGTVERLEGIRRTIWLAALLIAAAIIAHGVLAWQPWAKATEVRVPGHVYPCVLYKNSVSCDR